MDPRERWQALQAHLHAARRALDRGDRSEALERVERALALDPNFLAAHTLRERIRARTPFDRRPIPRELPGPRQVPGPREVPSPREMPTAREAPALRPAPAPVEPVIPLAERGPDVSPRHAAKRSEVHEAPVPAISADGWARFEQRARQRRIERRMQAARVAIGRKRFGAARDAMAEVRAIDAEHPELISVAMELDAAEHAYQQRPHRSRWLVAAAVFGGMVLGASYLEESPALRSNGAIAVARLVNAVVPAPISIVENAPVETLAELAVPEVPEPQTTDVQATARPPVATTGGAPETVRAAAAPPPPPVSRASDVVPAARAAGPPDADPPAFDPPAASDVVAAVNVPPAPRPPAPELVRDALPGAAGPASPASVAAASPAPPPTRTAPTRPAVSAASNANAPVVARAAVQDEQLVRDALQRYRAAYETLDVNGARAVWPAVNESALARAFDSLQSQRVTFDDCNVELSGPAARAECRGSARYVPKVGSREPRTESRTWNFTLRKSGEAWHIETARAAR